MTKQVERLEKIVLGLNKKHLKGENFGGIDLMIIKDMSDLLETIYKQQNK